MEKSRNAVKILYVTAMTLMLRIKDTGGELRVWQAMGGPAFTWLDATGRCIVGYERNDAHGRTHCVVYRGMGNAHMRETMPRRHGRMGEVTLCEECDGYLRTTDENDENVEVCWSCRRNGTGSDFASNDHATRRAESGYAQ
jgi:hypothetical protein